MGEKKYQDFDFAVEGMTVAQAEVLLAMIQAYVEALGLDMGGGFHETSDADYPEPVVDHGYRPE